MVYDEPLISIIVAVIIYYYNLLRKVFYFVLSTPYIFTVDYFYVLFLK